LLFSATATVILWQNAHVAVLFDLSYILNTAERIAAGQVPYRDFPLAHAPLTFLVQAAIIRLTGRVFFHHVLYTAAVGGLGTVLAWRIALSVLRGRVESAWLVALLLALPLTVLGVYCILPTPEYDCDCGFWILVAVWALLRIEQLPQQVPSHSERRPPWRPESKNLHLSLNENRTRQASVEDRMAPRPRGFLAGVAITIPLFFKQNMGLPFLFACVLALLFVIAATIFKSERSSNATKLRPSLTALGGVSFALISGAAALHFTSGIRNYIHWTIAYAGQRRLPGLDAMAGVYWYPALAWMLPCVIAGLVALRSGIGKKFWVQSIAFLLLAAPFLSALAALFLYWDDPDSRGDSFLMLWPVLLVLAAVLAVANVVRPWLGRSGRGPAFRAFLPLILLAAIHGALMSQQLWGSTYGIWPLLVLLLAELLAFLADFEARAGASRRSVPALAAFISAVLLICGGFYTASEERLSYAYLPAGPPVRSGFPALAGLTTPGPYLPEIDELLRYAPANIPFDDGIVLIPAEEPFYFATGRTPRFPVPFFDPTIDPYSPAEIAALVRSRHIRWLIVKTDVQTKEDPTPDRAAILHLLLPQFTPAAHLRGYEVYRR